MHFLNKDEQGCRYLPKPRMGVKVRLEGRSTLVLCSPADAEAGERILFMKPDVALCKLPQRIKVVDGLGLAVEPSSGRAFYVTRETFNPFHGLVEIPDGDM